MVRPLSVIIPALNEQACIGATLAALQPLRAHGCELIVVDGGSEDATTQIAGGAADQVLRAPAEARGRARQMNLGASVSVGKALLFLHADTRLPQDALEAILAGLADGAKRWGRFDVRLSGAAPALRVVEYLMNWRSRVSGIATGDQAIFTTRELFDQLGGFPELALMEDVEFSRRAKRLSRPLCLRQRVVTSSRRWEQRGVWRTIMLMWRLRLGYFFGADPVALARRYKQKAMS